MPSADVIRRWTHTVLEAHGIIGDYMDEKIQITHRDNIDAVDLLLRDPKKQILLIRVFEAIVFQEPSIYREGQWIDYLRQIAKSSEEAMGQQRGVHYDDRLEPIDDSDIFDPQPKGE